MKDSLRKHLVAEIAKDLWENPDDAKEIFAGLKAGYPDDALEIGLDAIAVNEERRLWEDPEFQQSLAELREGKCYEL